MEWSTRLRHPAFWTGMVATLVTLTQQLGYTVFPENINDIVATLLTLATMLGIVVDSTTKGIKDNKPMLEEKTEVVEK